MTVLKVKHPLDFGGHYYINLTYDTKAKELSADITGRHKLPGMVEQHLREMLTLEIAGQSFFLTSGKKMAVPELAGKALDVNVRLTPLNLKRKEELYGHIGFGPKGVETDNIIKQLTVFETRMLSNEVRDNDLPYKREGISTCPLRTDLHTHSSGEISAEGLMDIARKKDEFGKPMVLYPIRLLKKLGIDYSNCHAEETDRFFFPPKDAGKNIPKKELGIFVGDLNKKDQDKLHDAMSIPPDQQMTFGSLETSVYRYRYPITKHPKLVYDYWLKTAEEYKDQGIHYAEISAVSTSFLTPENLAKMHEYLPKIERETGVQLRFLAGIPRNLSDEMLKREVEKITLMGASPYIVGVDFMGFEDSKIALLKPYIKTIAQWATGKDENGNQIAVAHDPGFTLRIHAGENRKNMENVKQSLELAEQYGMRVRIGHAAHGLDDKAIEVAERLAKKGLVIIEFNPDSNMALNNIDRAEDLNIIKCIERKIPFVIGSDGSGIYQTDANQLWHAANFAASSVGMEADMRTWIIQSEEDHLKFEKKRFDQKWAELPPEFMKNIKYEYYQLPSIPTPSPSPSSMKEFKKNLERNDISLLRLDEIKHAMGRKKPLMILGARGSEHWEDIDEAQQKQIKLGIHTLLERLDPNKVYLMIGRPKDNGIANVLANEVGAYNLAHKEGTAFSLVSATVQAEHTEHSFTRGLTHVLPLEGNLYTVPDQLVDMIKKQKGHILFIGGGTFTRDAILTARNQNVPLGLMVGPKGASTDKAPMMLKGRSFEGNDGMNDHLLEAHPDWFKIPYRQSKKGSHVER